MGALDDITALLLEDESFWCEKASVLYGHSFGALVSFKTGLSLQQMGRPPLGLLVSARRAPHLAATDPLVDLSDQQLLAKLDSFGGVPDAIRHNAEMMEFYLPIIKADLHLNDVTTIGPDEKIDLPLYLYSARADGAATTQELESWKSVTTRNFSHRVFDGGHFFIQESENTFIATLRPLLEMLRSPDDEELIAF